jgi:WD40 repeat protein
LGPVAIPFFTHRKVRRTEKETESVGSVVFNPNDHRLASNGRDGRVKIWNVTPLPARP